MGSVALKQGPWSTTVPAATGSAPEESAPADPSASWLRRAQRGDLAAFDHLMRLHEHTVLRVAHRLLRRPEDAQDAVQETFLRLFRFLDRVDPDRPLAPWLYRLTVNVCRDLERRSSRRESVPLEDAVEPIATGTSADPAAAVHAAESRRRLGELLAELSDRERAALVLRDVEGLSTEQVAAALGSTAGTVRSQICRARLKLRALCAGNCEESTP